MDGYLIVANQTLGGKELDDVVRARVDRGHGTFHIVVPMVAPEEEATGWGGLEAPTAVTEPQTLDRARRRTERRLGDLVDRIEAAGGTATGEIGDSDPVYAVREILERESFDEVIISTLPARLSRWLKMDLPSRVSRMTDVPVTVVEASG